MSALEKIYRSAYMKLLNGPAEVLKKLSPPVELGTILKPNGAGVSAEDIRNPDTLLVILKALTKPQACQLASMYDQDMKLNTGGLRGLSPGGTRSLSRDVSPSPGSLSGSEIESSLHTPGSGTMTPTKKRKYNKTGKYSVKKRSMWTPPNGQSTAVSLTHTPPPARVAVVDERLSRPQRPVKSVHKDLNREVLVPLEERRRRPREIKHENDVSLRFREALAMDHHMVQNPDWRTPFRGTRDVIQRLLPFHVFQYPDAMIDSGIKRKEDVVAASSGTLAVRLKRLVDRYDSILVKEGSASSYSVDAIQMENHRISDVKQQLEQIHDAQLLQSISTTALPHHSSKPRF
ncbi:hypothetical protein GGI12_003456 [Dipsacomyces acuminosporus]|nr:hypothetical protein GGI12_003456 [Dipsacomyces acuminosporus]